MRKEFENILQEHGIFGEDVENILEAVADMLYLTAKKLEKDEPYAIKNIDFLKKASYEVDNLMFHYCED